MLRDLVDDETADDPDRLARAVRDARTPSAASYTPQLRGASSQHYTGERPLFDLYNIDDEIAKALARRVDLKSGGYLIIDQTEALTTIDVNTGGFVGARNFDDTIFKTNLEAAQAIARQLRLRNLGGIIIVDFIDMAARGAPRRGARRSSASSWRATARAMTVERLHRSSGLVEMTRKRTRESLAHMLCEPCPTCQGRGEVKTARSVCYDILREILREARAVQRRREFRIARLAAGDRAAARRGEPAPRRLSDFIGKPISLQVESSYSQEQYDIVLM